MKRTHPVEIDDLPALASEHAVYSPSVVQANGATSFSLTLDQTRGDSASEGLVAIEGGPQPEGVKGVQPDGGNPGSGAAGADRARILPRTLASLNLTICRI